MSTHISQTVLDKIQGENIKPKARWYFVVSHAMLWIPGIIVTCIGAIAVAGELYAITHAGWEFREFIYPTPIDFIVTLVPIVWLASFALFGALIVKALRTTHAGYRFSVKNILLGSVLVSCIAGSVIFLMDNTLNADSIIRYPIHEREQKIWFSPGEGRLSGFVEEKNDGTIIVRDKDGGLWVVDISGFSSTTFPFIEKGESLRIIGTSSDERFFVACAIFPWDIGRFPHPSGVKGEYLHPSLQKTHTTNPNCSMVLETIKQRTRERK